jgi:hypothetical protein
MTTNGNKLRTILTDNELTVDIVSQLSDVTINMLYDGCVLLSLMIKEEMTIMTSEFVKGIANDDLRTVESNLKILTCIQELNKLKLGEFNLN